MPSDAALLRDEALLELAAQQALLALTLSNPNPRVGCVIASAQGDILGLGHTQAAGGPHAEVMALRDALTQGRSVAGATAYVTLEPCSHQGRTPPCCDALVQAGIARVVASIADPNPLVAGQGFARLRAAGITVDVLPPASPQAQATRELNLGFFSRMQRKTPWVRLKIAASLDGTTALVDGTSQWITSEAARADGHAWRARACALLTGMGTVRQDNPRLDVRGAGSPSHSAEGSDRITATQPPAPRQPHLVLVDSRLEVPLDARIFETPRQRWIYAAVPDLARQNALQARGADVTLLPGAAAQAGRKVDLSALLQDLARREVGELHVEAGHQLSGSLVRAGLVDEYLVYLAPTLLGPGQGMAHIGPLSALAQGVALRFESVLPIGPDLRVLARGVGRADF